MKRHLLIAEFLSTPWALMPERIHAAIGGGSTAVSTSAIGLTQQGKFFGPFGVLCLNGITVTLAGADTITLVWTPI